MVNMNNYKKFIKKKCWLFSTTVIYTWFSTYSFKKYTILHPVSRWSVVTSVIGVIGCHRSPSVSLVTVLDYRLGYFTGTKFWLLARSSKYLFVSFLHLKLFNSRRTLQRSSLRLSSTTSDIQWPRYQNVTNQRLFTIRFIIFFLLLLSCWCY